MDLSIRLAPRRRVLPLLALAAALAAGRAAAAQGSSGTGSGIVLANEMVSCGGLSLTLSGAMAAASLGQVAGPEATSANYILRAGVSWTVPEVLSTGPIVFGATQMSADKDGGQTVEVRGFNFLQPGAGPLSVTFGGQLGTGTVVTSETIALTTVPGGVTALGNPPPLADVAVSNALGAHAAFTSPIRPSFVYEPALIRTDHARLGRTLHLHLLTDPGTSIILALGQTIPGVGVAISPLEGSAETLINVQLAVPFAPVTGDQYTHPVHVPDDPTLVGQSITFQGVALTGLAPLAGAFSNPLTLLIQP
jgi:hypothetical protein